MRLVKVLHWLHKKKSFDRQILMLGIMSLFACVQGYGQIRVEVTKWPHLSLQDSSIYISASFNGWSPGDEQYRLIREENVYFIYLPDTLTKFQYKFTQGVWSLVEGTIDGQVIANRVYDRDKAENPNLIRVEIAGWEHQPTYKLVVRSVPENTPRDATLYVMGDFNGWNPADKFYRLTKQVDGTWRVLLYETDAIQYKFTRGSKESTECGFGGKSIPNRTSRLADVGENAEIEFNIEAWSDLQDRSLWYSVFDIILLFSAFQGVLFLITLPSLLGQNKKANKWLLILIGFSSFVMLAKFVASITVSLSYLGKLWLIPDFFFFIYAPIFYLYIKQLFFAAEPSIRKIRNHFIPAVIHAFIYTIYLLMETQEVGSRLSNAVSDLNVVRMLAGALAIVFNFYYWMATLKVVKQYKIKYEFSYSHEQNLSHLNIVFFIQGACLLAWACFGLLHVGVFWFDWPIETIVYLGHESIWLGFSLVVFFLGYFALREPNIFLMPLKSKFQESITMLAQQAHDDKDFQEAASEQDDFDDQVKDIKEMMKRSKPFINPKITLIDLAAQLNMQPYLLSRIINQGFGKNFFDFINGYRVKEFIRRVEDPKNSHFTLLSIALDVGFNSKTAFNRSFKKIMGKTPSAYFQTLEETSS